MLDLEALDPDTRAMMLHFRYGHLPEQLQAKSKPFGELAELLVTTVPANRERLKALDKLLEAKDCAVRAALLAK